MPTMRERLARIGPRRIGRLLLVSFGLTILSFVGANLLAETRARGIANAASIITNTTVPTASHNSIILTELERQAMLLSDTVERVRTGEPVGSIPAEIRESQAKGLHEWQDLSSLPATSDEQALFNGIDVQFSELQGLAEKLLGQAARHDVGGTQAVWNDALRPGLVRLMRELRTLGELNRQRAITVSGQITSRFHTALLWSHVLTVMCAVLTCLTALVVVRVVRSYAASAEARVDELETFAGRVAHDIRSPLASVGLALDVTRRNECLDARAKSTLDRGTRTVERIGEVVDGLLVFARAGAPPDNEARTSAAEIVRDVVEAMRPAAQEKEIDLRIDPSDSCVAACHPGVLTSIVSNLVGNAIKYMGDAAVRQVDVRLHCPGKMVRVEVRDTGAGVPRDMQERIFHPHVRAAGATVPGLGLGLATVRRLAEAHGGAAGVDSTRGEGSLFWVELPRAE